MWLIDMLPATGHADSSELLACPSISPCLPLPASPPLQWGALKLWLINLLPTWGKLVYTSWLHDVANSDDPADPANNKPGRGGLVVTKSVYELLYGERPQRGHIMAAQLAWQGR